MARLLETIAEGAPGFLEGFGGGLDVVERIREGKRRRRLEDLQLEDYLRRRKDEEEAQALRGRLREELFPTPDVTARAPELREPPPPRFGLAAGTGESPFPGARIGLQAQAPRRPVFDDLLARPEDRLGGRPRFETIVTPREGAYSAVPEYIRIADLLAGTPAGSTRYLAEAEERARQAGEVGRLFEQLTDLPPELRVLAEAEARGIDLPGLRQPITERATRREIGEQIAALGTAVPAHVREEAQRTGSLAPVYRWQDEERRRESILGTLPADQRARAEALPLDELERFAATLLTSEVPTRPLGAGRPGTTRASYTRSEARQAVQMAAQVPYTTTDAQGQQQRGFRYLMSPTEIAVWANQLHEGTKTIEDVQALVEERLGALQGYPGYGEPGTGSREAPPTGTTTADQLGAFRQAVQREFQALREELPDATDEEILGMLDGMLRESGVADQQQRSEILRGLTGG